MTIQQLSIPSRMLQINVNGVRYTV